MAAACLIADTRPAPAPRQPRRDGAGARPRRAAAGFAELIGRAKAAGKLRQVFAHQDLVLILMANAGVVSGTGDAAPDAWRRLVGYLLQAFAAEAARRLPPPPSEQQMYRALLRLQPGSD